MIDRWPQSDPIWVPAGAWVRERWLPRPPRDGNGKGREMPEWHGSWHLATGDVRAYAHNSRKMTAACGRGVAASVDKGYGGEAISDAVVVDEMPLVDVCLTCVSRSGADVTIRIRERQVVIEPGPANT